MPLDARASHHQLVRKIFINADGVELRRRVHENYTVPPLDLPGWVLSRYQWQGEERVLDIGSGTGVYVPYLRQFIPAERYIGLDISYGMTQAGIENADSPTHFVVGDMEEIPFADNSFDVILANFVLYHAYDVEHALEEIHRVLHPEGVLIAATNSQLFNMKEFDTLIHRAFRLLGYPLSDRDSERLPLNQFSLESGTVKLGRHFKSVARYDLPGTLVFSEAQPVIDYINSLYPFYETVMPAELQWSEFMTIMADQVQRFIRHFGELVVNKLAGVLVATDEGGFAAEYQQYVKALAK